MSGQSKNSGQGASDDVKAKFREALARKNGRHEEHEGDRPDSVVHAHTGPAKAQRQFRRKSGG
ncbi:DUF5302 domain-containing protein [Angustibacter sp. Root456]|uniref:DUF5302 domain-containing protein n=1 Tax=Angustibacter sp. Root456 TaxID=1736539 RepID=UPI0006FD4621|nr:DUF5302 domain-containing protein [Angustibacter sp. Root456]KQX64546.1 hypothetical protein ASD06_10375 [Angustibacter sp. Root456]